MVLSLPNVLTLSRIVAIPAVVALFFVPGPAAQWAAGVVFVAAAVTDFFDGWLARRWQQVSHFGRFLDPIADKLMVAAVLMMLVGAGRVATVTTLPALVILGREILVSGLREYLAQLNVGMPVTGLAKWKTGIQMVAITILLVGDAGPVLPWVVIGEAGLWIAGVLTLITGWDYMRAGLAHMRAADRA